jgi:hypothetical protein
MIKKSKQNIKKKQDKAKTKTDKNKKQKQDKNKNKSKTYEKHNSKHQISRTAYEPMLS